MLGADNPRVLQDGGQCSCGVVDIHGQPLVSPGSSKAHASTAPRQVSPSPDGIALAMRNHTTRCPGFAGNAIHYLGPLINSFPLKLAPLDSVAHN